MKIKNIILKTFAVSLVTLGSISCSDSFLDEKMYSNFDPSVNDVESKVVGLYRQYAAIWGMSGQQGFLSCFQVGTDVCSPGQTQGVEVGFYNYPNLNSENAGVSFLWEKLYEIINSANLIIDSQGENGDKAAVAEAKFFRAYAYNMLVTLWGGVPLVTKYDGANPRTDYVRETVDKVDEVIDADLQYAMTYLPNVDTSNRKESRATKDFARQLAGEAYLRMGMRDASFFKKAEDALTLIISEGKYKLIDARYGKYLAEGGDSYRDMFRFGNQRRSEGNTEGIWTFEMEYNRDVNGGTIDNPQHRYYNIDGMVNADSLGGRGIGRLRLSNFTKYHLFQKGDIRNSNYNIRRTMYYNKPGFHTTIGIDANGFKVTAGKGVKDIVVKTGDKVVPAAGDSLGFYYPHPTKWGGYDPNDDFGYAVVKDWPVMRYSETYLLRAEARFRQNNLTGAAEDINVIRDRAFKAYRTEISNPSYGKVSASDINIDFILDERARELIAEENRRMTLIRTNTLSSRILKNGDASPDNKIIVGFKDYNTLLPIPLTEIQLNKDAVLEQNTGY